MININIKPFFRFAQVKIISQHVNNDLTKVIMKVVPDRRYTPRCSKCGTRCKSIHSQESRIVRDIDIFRSKVYIKFTYRKLRCPQCNAVKVEELDLVAPYQRITRRFAQYIVDFCRYMTVEDVSRVLDVDRRLVKNLHKEHLKSKFGKDNYEGVKCIAIDEISVKKGHKYLTIVMDWDTGRIIHVGIRRSYRTLKEFFKNMPRKYRKRIEAVAMDMWDPYIKAVHEWCPDAKIVFDLFHVLQGCNRMIDKVRNMEYKKALEANKEAIKGTKYILLKNWSNLGQKERSRLKNLLDINRNISIVYFIKDYIKKLWQYKYEGWVKKGIENIVKIARESAIKPLIAFAKTITRYAYGIINHCKYPIHTSRIEGVNNKIKVIKRKAYGFHDIEYFSLIIKSAFVPLQLIRT